MRAIIKVLLLATLFLNAVGTAFAACYHDYSRQNPGSYVMKFKYGFGDSSNYYFYWEGKQVARGPYSMVVGNTRYYVGSRKTDDTTNNTYEICVEDLSKFSHNSFETQTAACPTSHPSGLINRRRDFEVWTDGSKRNYSGWYETSRTCAAVKTGNSSETKSLTCPATHPAGTWTQRRSFETWSDGVNRNHGAWADVTKTCAATKVRNASETQILACEPLTPSGTWKQSRPYEVWTDGNRNFGTWSNVSVCYNQTPSVSNRTLAHDEDTTGSLTLTAVDDHSQITYELVSQPANGSASISGTKLSFTPRADWNGTTSLTYRAKDPAGAISNTATITITVNPVNDTPGVTNLTHSMAEDTAATITLPVVDVDIQFEGDSHTWNVVTAPNATHGTVVISRNKATFTPKPNWNGTTTFTYRATDSKGAQSNTGTVTITVTPVNDTPSVSNATLAIDEDTVGTLSLGVTDVDLGFEGDSHTWSIVTAPNAAHGTASISGNKLTFTPKSNWNGTATLTYRVRDSKGANSNTATVTVTVRPINDKAVVQNVSRSIPEDTSVTIPLVLEDVDLQFEGDSHTFEILDSLPAEQGRYTLTGNSLEVVPARDWNGTISLRYLARDSHGLASDAKLIKVEVTYVNDAPTATGATIPAREGMASDHVDPWVHDVDLPYGDEHTFEIVEQPANGSAKVVHGRLEYTPRPQYFGPDSFIIRATDKEGASIDGQVKVVVDKFNYAATDIAPGRVKMYAGIGGTAQLKAIDPNTWGSHTFEVVEQPAHGTVTVEGDIITLRTDESTDTSVLIRTTDQDGLTFEKNIALEFVSAWEMFAGREVVSSGATPSIPAVREQLMHRDGSYAMKLTSAEVVSQLGSDLIAIVTPSSSVGLVLEHRELAPEIGMRLTPTKLTGEYLEAKLGALNPGTDATVQLLLSRADMTGPVYAVPVKSWTPQGKLTADRWKVMQGLDKAKIQFSPDESLCVIQTSEQMAKSKNVLEDPTCLVEWEQTPEEWRDTSYSSVLSMEAVGRSLGKQPVKATAYIFDSNGGKHWIADFEHGLEVVEVGNSVVYGLQPAPEEVYQSVQDLSLVLRQKEGQQCEPTTNLSAAQNAAKNWQSRTLCYVRWTALPEGLEQSKSWYTPQVVGNANVLGEQSISWKVSVFTPSGKDRKSVV